MPALRQIEFAEHNCLLTIRSVVFQTLAQAYTDPDVEQGCLQVTEQALQGLGLRPGLVALCAVSLRKIGLDVVSSERVTIMCVCQDMFQPAPWPKLRLPSMRSRRSAFLINGTSRH